MTSDLETGSLIAALQVGEIELKGQFMLGSNYTFLVDVHYQNETYPAVYKPQRGEQPLWDFPDATLAQREVAAYLVSQALGWCFVPFTLLREDGPHGPGSLQQFISYDPNYHYFTFSRADKLRLRPVALFDLITNNADRKGSHVFIESETDKLWLIDHGLCFHVQDKLRTVIWDFAGQAIPQELLSDLSGLQADLGGNSDLRVQLEPYLFPEEIEVLAWRVGHYLEHPVFPLPPDDRRVLPWPPV